MIKAYVQNSKQNNKTLFASIGQWAVSEAVHDAVGMPITAIDDDVWFVGGGAKPTGFAQLRLMTNGSGHIRYLYSASETNRATLLRGVLAYAKKLKLSLVYTNDKASQGVWQANGFKASKKHKGTRFTRWEKELE